MESNGPVNRQETSELCPNLSEIITRMMSGVASSVVVKVHVKQDRVYLWSDSLERDKVMALLAKPPSGSVWDTFMSKGASEGMHVVTAQISANSSKLKNNSGGKNQVRQMQRNQWRQCLKWQRKMSMMMNC